MIYEGRVMTDDVDVVRRSLALGRRLRNEASDHASLEGLLELLMKLQPKAPWWVLPEAI